MLNPVSNALLDEYAGVVARLPSDASDEETEAALIVEGAWTKDGARAILGLARQYGSAILRDALALACAMGIEDGEAGL